MNANHIPPRPRRRNWAGPLACCLAAVTPLGCLGPVGRSKPPAPQQASAAQAIGGGETVKSETGVIKTDFRAEVGPEQRIGIHMDLARAMESQGNFEAAASEYLRALEEIDQVGRHIGKNASAQKALAHRRMAAALDRIGRFAQAEVHYQDALKLSPNDPKVWNDSGYSAYLQHRWPEAEQRLRTAARLAPDEPKIRTNLGLCLAAAGKRDQALEELTKAGGPAVGYANLAYVLAALGNTTEARKHYEIALQLDPGLQSASTALAKLDADATKPQATQLAGTGTVTPTPTTARPATDGGVMRTSVKAPATAISTAPVPVGTATQPRRPGAR